MIKNDISKNLFIIIVVCVNLVFVPGAYAISLCNKRKALCQREKSGGVSKYYRKKDYQQRDREKKLKDQNHICNDKIEKIPLSLLKNLYQNNTLLSIISLIIKLNG